MTERWPAGGLIAQDVVHEIGQRRAKQRLGLRGRPIDPDGMVHAADLQHCGGLEGGACQGLTSLGTVICKNGKCSSQVNGGKVEVVG